MKKLACVFLMILTLGSTTGCVPIPPELYGVSQTEWDSMSPAQQTQTLYEISSVGNNGAQWQTYS